MKRSEFLRRAKCPVGSVQTISDGLAEEQAKLAEEAGVQWEPEEELILPGRVEVCPGAARTTINDEQRFDVVVPSGSSATGLWGTSLNRLSAVQRECAACYMTVRRDVGRRIDLASKGKGDPRLLLENNALLSILSEERRRFGVPGSQ